MNVIKTDYSSPSAINSVILYLMFLMSKNKVAILLANRISLSI